MEVTPASASKTPRARSKAKTAEGTAKPAAPRKARSKKAAPEALPEVTSSALAPVLPENASTRPSEDELRSMIAHEAYLLAEQRSFAPGGELQDWLEAERRVLARI